MSTKTYFGIGILLALASLLIQSPASAMNGEMNAFGLTTGATMMPSGAEPNAGGSVMGRYNRQGMVTNQQLRIVCNNLRTNATYFLMAHNGYNTNLTHITVFQTDHRGIAAFDLRPSILAQASGLSTASATTSSMMGDGMGGDMGGGYGGWTNGMDWGDCDDWMGGGGTNWTWMTWGGLTNWMGGTHHGWMPLPDDFIPICDLIDFAIVNTSTQLVMTVDLTNPNTFRYDVNCPFISCAGLSNAVASLNIRASQRTTRFRMTAAGLAPGGTYHIAVNDQFAGTMMSDARGRLNMRSLPNGVTNALDWTSMAIWDAASNCVLRATLPTR